MKNPVSGTFRSLRSFNFRLWTAGALVSNVGTWMQRVAQDWLVLTQLTHRDASALGIVMGLQFAPQLLLLPWSGLAADRLNQRKLLMLTQATMGVLALILGVITIAGVIQLWHVYVLACLSGSAAALDAPVRQTFVAEMVGDADLSNAVALNSTSFNAAQMIGPAVAGLLIASVGIGWAFLLNGLSFAAVLISMSFFRLSELHKSARAHPTTSGFLEGLRYVWRRPDLRAILIMLFLIGTFGMNFPIFISTMAVNVFHSDARAFGLLSSIMAVGTLSGALFAAGRQKPGLPSLLWGSWCLWDRLYPGRTGAWILVVRGHSHNHRSGCSDLRQRHQQHHAALYRTSDAGQGYGPASCHRTRGNTDWRTDHRLGCQLLRPALVARHWRDSGLRRCAGRSPRSGPPKKATARPVISSVKSASVH
jgi:MFS family permease